MLVPPPTDPSAYRPATPAWAFAESGPAGPWPGSYLASWGQRVGASLIDSIPILGVYVAMVVNRSASGVAVLAMFAFMAWNLVRQGRTGQTIGKRMTGLALVRESDGSYVGPWLSLGRQLLHATDSALCYLGYLWPLWDDKRQTFADKIVGTLVIVVPPERSDRY